MYEEPVEGAVTVIIHREVEDSYCQVGIVEVEQLEPVQMRTPSGCVRLSKALSYTMHTEPG